jgi:uncharacterized protein
MINHGLDNKTTAGIQAVISRYPQVEKALLYGSRAKGNYRAGSDIDLTLVGHGLDHSILCRIAGDLDDLMLPYRIDLSIFDKITHADLIEHIKRVGVVFFEKNSAAVKR